MSGVDPERGERPRRASPLDVAKTVLSGFFGVRRRDRHDAARVTPLQIIVAGVIGAALFVLALLALVNFVVSRFGAGA